MEEILELLSKRDDYCIFAGFAAKILVNTKVSADIDILMLTNREELVKELESKGWKKEVITEKVTRLQKEDEEIDVCLAEISVLFNSRQKVKYKEWEIFVLSPEALFITKMNNQLTKPDRTPDKITRDRETIKKLREKIDPKKLRELLAELPDDFWTKRKW